MARADAPPLYWSDDAKDADWAGGGGWSGGGGRRLAGLAWGGRLRGAVRRRLARPRSTAASAS